MTTDPCWNCDDEGAVIAHEDEPGAFPIVCPVCKGEEECMSDCGCEGSCPVCWLGEVDNHKCDRCGAEICPKCHGLKNMWSPNLERCLCKGKEVEMRLSEALDVVYGRRDWHNPISPYFVSGIIQTPYEAYMKLKLEYQVIVRRLVGHEPEKNEGIEE